MNKNLTSAKKAKNDEFYTQIADIENELKHYKDFFKGKVVYLNCDDPEESNFWKFFELKFEDYQLKKLIATHFDKEKPTYKLELFSDVNGDGRITKADIVKTTLTQNGDFRSPESIELLKECDVVVTNPPFSLFREYIAQLIKYKKYFLVIGNMNAITYKEIFPLIKDNKLWYGESIHSGDRKFYVPDNYQLNASTCGIDENGKRFINVKGVRWFTNIPTKKRSEKLVLGKKYNAKDYPKYDNYDAINVDKTIDIPYDYTGIIGVPITFFDKYNPDQFEIIGMANTGTTGDLDLFKPLLNGKQLFKRLLIRKI